MIKKNDCFYFQGAIRQVMVMNNLRTINFKRWRMWNEETTIPQDINSIRLDMKGGIKIYINSKGGYKGKEIKNDELWEMLYSGLQEILKGIDSFNCQERKNILIPVGR